jgi:hypothetical protein
MSAWFQSGRIVKDEIGKRETRFFTKYFVASGRFGKNPVS